MRKQKERRRAQGTQPVLIQGRTGWLAGLRWVDEKGAGLGFWRNTRGDTHWIQTGRKPDRMVGFALPARIRRGIRLCSLAAAFLVREGGNSYGIYRLDEAADRWVFLATVRGRLSVMGDVVGTLQEVAAARERFMEFNDPGDMQRGWHCSARPEQPESWQNLIGSLTRTQRRHVHLRQIPSLRKLGMLAFLVVGVSAALFYWRDDAGLRARQAAALAEYKARQVLAEHKPAVEPQVVHPWASLLPSSVFLSQCWFTREPLPVSVVGWRLTAGECTQAGLRLRYVAMPGTTVEDFARRAKHIFGQSAVFDLKDGGQNGDVNVPYAATSLPARDEAVPDGNTQLMRFVTHLQRRNIRVRFTEIKPPDVIPGAANTAPPQDWREFTFAVNTRLAPEWMLAGCDDIGLRLFSIAFTLSPQGQFDYTVKGSLYAQR
ncbi:type 4b pilus protein PilO2 [Pectobacteriaceae bacterium CE70]|nr:type 4b pilus protein PilO2 [Pectobacteriaceae bacterium C52]WJV67853.1 type 4b pilus protein PilO2 [Pectobacteriaceae bacterium CE70]WJY11796.1 type 4b pilus protein PilO2 [Pectobacteriaceae bacterium C80]